MTLDALIGSTTPPEHGLTQEQIQVILTALCEVAAGVFERTKNPIDDIIFRHARPSIENRAADLHALLKSKGWAK